MFCDLNGWRHGQTLKPSLAHSGRIFLLRLRLLDARFQGQFQDQIYITSCGVDLHLACHACKSRHLSAHRISTVRQMRHFESAVHIAREFNLLTGQQVDHYDCGTGKRYIAGSDDAVDESVRRNSLIRLRVQQTANKQENDGRSQS